MSMFQYLFQIGKENYLSFAAIITETNHSVQFRVMPIYWCTFESEAPSYWERGRPRPHLSAQREELDVDC
jgi:hypothetical protein